VLVSYYAGHDPLLRRSFLYVVARVRVDDRSELDEVGVGAHIGRQVRRCRRQGGSHVFRFDRVRMVALPPPSVPDRDLVHHPANLPGEERLTYGGSR
jgi:hypothetical protein